VTTDGARLCGAGILGNTTGWIPAFADDEVGHDLSKVDWAATPLGPPDEWPHSLRAAVSILISSRFSMWRAGSPSVMSRPPGHLWLTEMTTVLCAEP
jgi:hypothetical protein